MLPVIQAAFTTASIYLIASCTGYKKSKSIYLTIFLLMVGISYLFSDNLHAEENWSYHIRSKNADATIKSILYSHAIFP